MAKTETRVETKLCSACKERPRVDQAEGATNTQCTECKYEAQKRWTMSKAEQDYAKAFLAGVKATKDLLASEFANAIRGAMISGTEAARLVRVCRGPFPTSPAT